MFENPMKEPTRQMNYAFVTRPVVPKTIETKIIGTMRNENCKGCGFTLLAIEDKRCPRCNRALSKKKKERNEEYVNRSETVSKGRG